jgi:hypothetical protein
MTKSIAMYKGYTYYGDFDEVEEVNFSTDGGEVLKNKIELISVRLPYLAYQVKGIEVHLRTCPG